MQVAKQLAQDEYEDFPQIQVRRHASQGRVWQPTRAAG